MKRLALLSTIIPLSALSFGDALSSDKQLFSFDSSYHHYETNYHTAKTKNVGGSLSQPINEDFYFDLLVARSYDSSSLEGYTDNCDTASDGLAIGSTYSAKDLPSISITYSYARSETCTFKRNLTTNETSIEKSNSTSHVTQISSAYLIKQIGLNAFYTKHRSISDDDSYQSTSGSLGASYFLTSHIATGFSMGGFDAQKERSFFIGSTITTANSTFALSADRSWNVIEQEPRYSLTLSYYPRQKTSLKEIFKR